LEAKEIWCEGVCPKVELHPSMTRENRKQGQINFPASPQFPFPLLVWVVGERTRGRQSLAPSLNVFSENGYQAG
jgi:hypothetical protein